VNQLEVMGNKIVFDYFSVVVLCDQIPLIAIQVRVSQYLEAFVEGGGAAHNNVHPRVWYGH
jgi:hypothetical protein